MRKSLSLAVLMMMAVGAPAFADDASVSAEVSQAARKLGDGTVAAVKAEDKAERRRLLREAAAPVIDFKAIAQSVLAYAGAKVPDSRQAEVTEQVIAFMGDKITGELERIRPESVSVSDVTVKSPTEARVSMTLTGPQDSIDGSWQFRKIDGAWKVVEIGVTGGTLTSHFGEKLARYARGVDQLVDYLRQQKERSQTAQRPS